jgi:hypothetical protein
MPPEICEKSASPEKDCPHWPACGTVLRGVRKSRRAGQIRTFCCRCGEVEWHQVEKVSLLDRFPWHDERGKARRLEVTAQQVFYVIRVLYWGEDQLEEARAVSRMGNDTIQDVRDWVYQWLDNPDFTEAIVGFDDAINADSYEIFLRLCRARERYRNFLLEKGFRSFIAVSKEREVFKRQREVKLLKADLDDYRLSTEKILRKWSADLSPIEFKPAPNGTFLGPARRKHKRKHRRGATGS